MAAITESRSLQYLLLLALLGQICPGLSPYANAVDVYLHAVLIAPSSVRQSLMSHFRGLHRFASEQAQHSETLNFLF